MSIMVVWQSVIGIALFNVFASIATHGKCLEMMS